jgi:predicted AAA+ superfamily ATPase
MLISRTLDLAALLAKKSQFLLGPRQTGKTFLVRQTLSRERIYNLLDFSTFLRLSQNPSLLREELQGHEGPVIIDEIQKIPILLDEVQILIEEQRLHFLLTGSSARKLRRSGVNLLGGRARTIHMHALTSAELGTQFDLMRAVNYGTLPAIYLSDDPQADLKAYAGEYLKEEIAAEGLTRNVPAFSRFLEVAALSNGQIINFQTISSDAAVPRTTVQEYFSILKDTLIAEELEPWRKTKKRKAITTSKFYFFDVGVANQLQNAGKIEKKSKLFGDAFEAFIFQELAAYRDYISKGSVHFWRSDKGHEVDFILDEKVAIEVKGKQRLSRDDFKGLTAIQEEKLMKKHIIVCLDSVERVTAGIHVVPWQKFLKNLWSGQYSL